MYYQLWWLVWGRKTLATTTKERKKTFKFFPTRLFVFCTARQEVPGIKQMKENIRRKHRGKIRGKQVRGRSKVHKTVQH